MNWINGIEQREFKNTLVPRVFDLGDYGSTTLNVYQYNHDYKKLYREFELDKRLLLQKYEAPSFEAAKWKNIPMRYRWNAVIRELMMTGRYRIKYRGTSKRAVGYKRKQNYCLCEYADTFAIYLK